jgi:hypothetical protein
MSREMELSATTEPGCDLVKEKLILYRKQKEDKKSALLVAASSKNRCTSNPAAKENKAPSNRQVVQRRSLTATSTGRCLSNPAVEKRKSFAKTTKPIVQSSAVAVQVNDAHCVDISEAKAVHSSKRTSFSECDDVRLLMDCDDEDNLAVGELANPTSLRFSFGDRDRQEFCSNNQHEEKSSSSLKPIEKIDCFQQVKDEMMIKYNLW